jgi:uncharacterized membrane protein YraQ (UPF0718 family)
MIGEKDTEEPALILPVYRGFWKELISRSNQYVNTMAIISLVISAPIVLLSCIALIYDVFYLGHGLKDTSVRLLLGLITASTGGLAASQFSKRTYTEMIPNITGKRPVPDPNSSEGEK